MRVRALQTSDLPMLAEFAQATGFPYINPQSANVEAVLVVADDEDRPILAVAAERICQLYLWLDPDLHATTSLAGLRLLHEEMANKLRTNGYTSCEAYLPPGIATRFGRRLEKSFGWVRNWQSWTRSF